MIGKHTIALVQALTLASYESYCIEDTRFDECLNWVSMSNPKEIDKIFNIRDDVWDRLCKGELFSDIIKETCDTVSQEEGE